MENHVEKTPTKLVRVEVRTDATKDGAYAFKLELSPIYPGLMI